jgi:hypothetical protein
MDAKTMLLLGIGMAVLLLLGFCVAPSHSAALPEGQQLPSRSSTTPGGRQAWSSGRERYPFDQRKASSRRFFQVVEHPAMLVGLEG